MNFPEPRVRNTIELAEIAIQCTRGSYPREMQAFVEADQHPKPAPIQLAEVYEPAILTY